MCEHPRENGLQQLGSINVGTEASNVLEEVFVGALSAPVICLHGVMWEDVTVDRSDHKWRHGAHQRRQRECGRHKIARSSILLVSERVVIEVSTGSRHALEDKSAKPNLAHMCEAR